MAGRRDLGHLLADMVRERDRVRARLEENRGWVDAELFHDGGR
jgi:hypothetical protein